MVPSTESCDTVTVVLTQAVAAQLVPVPGLYLT